MEAKQAWLQEKLENLLKEASAVAVELQAITQEGQTPHFDQIELPAHGVGQRLSRMIQSQRSRELAAEHLQDVRCPTCQSLCQVEIKDRTIHSMDGPIEITETVCHCRRCRRSFFPSA